MYTYVTNEELNNDLYIKWEHEVIEKYATT